MFDETGGGSLKQAQIPQSIGKNPGESFRPLARVVAIRAMSTLLNLPLIRNIVHAALKQRIRPSFSRGFAVFQEETRLAQEGFSGWVAGHFKFSKSFRFKVAPHLHYRLTGLDQSELTRKIYWFGLPALDLEPNDPAWANLSKARTILDVGANIGIYSLVARQAAPNARIFALEPQPRNFEILRRNIELNSSNVVCCPLAACDRSGQIDLYIPSGENDASTRLTFPEEARDASVPFEIARVDCTSIDDFVQEKGLTDVDFVKLDTEGTEFEVLCGMQRLLADQRPDIMCELIFGHDRVDDIEAMLAPFGYLFYRLGSGEAHHLTQLVADAKKADLNFLFTTKALS